MSDTLYYHAATRGDRYQVKVYRTSTGEYRAEYLTRGVVRGVSAGYSRPDLVARIRRYVVDAREIDGIDYRCRLDDLQVHRDPIKRGES